MLLICCVLSAGVLCTAGETLTFPSCKCPFCVESLNLPFDLLLFLYLLRLLLSCALTSLCTSLLLIFTFDIPFAGWG
jgi:hypothetical protein